jgi:hypothetical protein
MLSIQCSPISERAFLFEDFQVSLIFVRVRGACRHQDEYGALME